MYSIGKLKVVQSTELNVRRTIGHQLQLEVSNFYTILVTKLTGLI